MLPTPIIFSAIYLIIATAAVFLFDGEKRFIAAYVIMSLITYIAYALDKNAAKKGKWRTPEKTLHLLSLFGGWPGALCAQHQFRHKTQKQPFKSILWLTIVFNIAAFILSFRLDDVDLIQSASQLIEAL